MTLATRYALVKDGAFTNKLQMAIWIAAAAVKSEPAGTPNHANRLIWAKKAVKKDSDPDEMRTVAINASANDAIGAAGAQATDADIQFVVNSLIDDLAGTGP